MMKTYQTSGAAGNRLAAIAMMQMESQKLTLIGCWIGSDMRGFHFYHVALALQNAVDSSSGESQKQAIDAADQAIQILGSFAGTVDKDTMHVLQALAPETPN
jgi:hypothetical protein